MLSPIFRFGFQCLPAKNKVLISFLLSFFLSSIFSLFLLIASDDSYNYHKKSRRWYWMITIHTNDMRWIYITIITLLLFSILQITKKWFVFFFVQPNQNVFLNPDNCALWAPTRCVETLVSFFFLLIFWIAIQYFTYKLREWQ